MEGSEMYYGIMFVVAVFIALASPQLELKVLGLSLLIVATIRIAKFWIFEEESTL